MFEDVKSLMVGSVIRDSHDLLNFLVSVMKSEDPYIEERKKSIARLMPFKKILQRHFWMKLD